MKNIKEKLKVKVTIVSKGVDPIDIMEKNYDVLTVSKGKLEVMTFIIPRDAERSSFKVKGNC